MFNVIINSQPPWPAIRQKTMHYNSNNFRRYVSECDRPCGLVVRVSGYRTTGPEFDSQRYHILWVLVGLERGPLSLERISEELLERKISGSGLKTENDGRGKPPRWPRDSPLTAKVDTKNQRPVVVSQSVYVAWGLKSMEFFIWPHKCQNH
jgi:hypothetical protein